MYIQPIKTHKITPVQSTNAEDGLLALLDHYLPTFTAQSVLVITAKIIAILQQRVLPTTADRQAVIEAEADQYLPPRYSRYRVTLTMKGGILIPSAGVDESNGNGQFVLWPKQPQAIANRVRAYLCTRFGIREAGVLITDSRPLPLRWGVTGVGMAHSGFRAINDLIGTLDLFGRPLTMTKINVMDGLAAAAVLVMGEGAEQTPLAVASDLPFVHFQQHDPTDEEVAALQIAPEDDLYEPLLRSAAWEEGGRTSTTNQSLPVD